MQAEQLRPVIRESWARCEAWKIDRETTDPPYVGELERGEPLRRAAEPVLDELCGLLAGSGTAVVLCDAGVQVLEARHTDAQVRGTFEANHGTPGYTWREEEMGTSAVALATVHERPQHVAGSEHYLSHLGDITAAAAPIFDPFTKALAGALNLSGKARDASAHMLTAAVQAARAIERRLGDSADPADRRAYARFAREAAQGANDALWVVSDRMTLSNPEATRMLGALERQALLEQIEDARDRLRIGWVRIVVPLLDGRELEARLERIDPGASRAGVLVRVTAAALAGPHQTPGSAPGPPDVRIGERVTPRHGVLMVGEPGSGKLWAAREAHRRSGRRNLAVLDGATDAAVGHGSLRDLVDAATDPDTTLVIQHLECLPRQSLTMLRSMLASSASGTRLVATVTVGPHEAPPADLVDLFPRQVRVMPLRSRTGEMPAIATALMRRHGATGRLQPAVMAALTAHDWPGNVRELDAVIRAVVMSRRTCDITTGDLPPRFGVPVLGRRLTRMEQIERVAIEDALAEARGNRTRAAKILQIGRATLYRKLKAYGLENEAVVSN